MDQRFGLSGFRASHAKRRRFSIRYVIAPSGLDSQQSLHLSTAPVIRVEAQTMSAEGYSGDGSDLRRLVNNAAKMHGDQYRVRHYLSLNRTEAAVLFQRDHDELLRDTFVGIRCRRKVDIRRMRGIILDYMERIYDILTQIATNDTLPAALLLQDPGPDLQRYDMNRLPGLRRSFLVCRRGAVGCRRD